MEVSNFPRARLFSPPSREWSKLSWAKAHPYREKIESEAGKICETIKSIVNAFRPHTDSPFRHNERILINPSLEDITKLQDTLVEAVPITEENKGLYAHLHLAGSFGHAIADESKLPDGLGIDPYFLNAAGNLNDIGKLTGVFRYHFNDLISETMLQRMNIRLGVRRCFPRLEFNIGPLHHRIAKDMEKSDVMRHVDAYVVRISKTLTLRQEIFILADVCGKAKKPDFQTIQTFEEMEEVHMSTRQTAADYEEYIGEKALWPSEIYAYNRLSGLAEGWLKIYRSLRDKWKRQGADVDEIRKRLQDQQV